MVVTSQKSSNKFWSLDILNQTYQKGNILMYQKYKLYFVLC